MAPSLASDNTNNKKETYTAPTKKAMQPLPLISSSELRRHNTASSLWLSIHGLVYDVTPWIPLHPGGDLPLLSLAGLDATDPFLAYHPSSAHEYLSKYLIGRLSDRSISPVSRSYRNLLGTFTAQGLFDRKGLVFPASIAATFLLLITSVSLVVFVKDSFLLHLLAGVVMGFVWIQSGWLGHDSGHYRVIPNPAPTPIQMNPAKTNNSLKTPNKTTSLQSPKIWKGPLWKGPLNTDGLIKPNNIHSSSTEPIHPSLPQSSKIPHLSSKTSNPSSSLLPPPQTAASSQLRRTTRNIKTKSQIPLPPPRHSKKTKNPNTIKIPPAAAG